MALNYTRLRDLAERLIEENGREVTLIRQDQANPTDPARPWRSSTEASEISITADAVIIPSDFESTIADLTKRQDLMALVAAKPVEANNVANTNLEDYNELLDNDGTRYRIESGMVIKPGPSRILYMLKVKQ